MTRRQRRRERVRINYEKRILGCVSYRAAFLGIPFKDWYHVLMRGTRWRQNSSRHLSSRPFGRGVVGHVHWKLRNA